MARDVALQPDGKILLGGYGTFDLGGGNTGESFVVVRYDIDGSLDSSFGTDGIAVLDSDALSYADDAYAMALQPDGKIVLAGVYGDGNVLGIALARIEADGTLDTSFGDDGMVRLVPTGTDMVTGVSGMVLQADGRIVVFGQAVVGAEGPTILARFEADGSLDTSFDSDGVLLTGSSTDWAMAVRVQADGKLVTAGRSGNDLLVARYRGPACSRRRWRRWCRRRR